MIKPVYDDTFKCQTFQHIRESGQTVAEVTRELKINDNTVYGRIKKFGTDPEVVATQVFKSDEHQMWEMQKRIRELHEENQSLKERCITSRKTVGKVFVHP